MASLPVTRLTLEQYLEAERASQGKHEYYQGQMYDMAGGTVRHGQVALSAALAIGPAARRRGCIPLSSDVRIRVGHDSFYPHMSVVCGQFQTAPNDTHAITNPALVVEVLSESTEGFDRGHKGIAYRTLPSLREYVLVSQAEPLIERYKRKDDGTWEYAQAAGLDASIHLSSLDATVALADVYVDVVFDPVPAE